MVLARVRAGLAGLALVLFASAAVAQTTPTLTGAANGVAVSLNWTVVPGATGYDVIASLNGIPLAPIPVGPTTSVNVVVAPGVYSVAVRGTAGSQAGPTSNVVTLTAALTPPAAPTNLAAAVGGNNVVLTWDVNTAGLTGLAVQAGTAAGAADLGTFPLAVSKSLSLPLPNGNYFVRMFSVSAAGPSAPSAEVAFTTPGCVPPASLQFTATSNGSFVQASWAPVPGATGYRLDVSSTPGGAPDVTSVPFGPGTTTFNFLGAPLGTFYLSLHSAMSCGPVLNSAEIALTVTPPVRQPAKSEAGARAMVIEATNSAAAQYRGDLFNSCGNNTWMFRVLQRLRQQDNRFGLNWKRGNVGDLSQDVITYIFDDTPEEFADQRHIWMWDIIVGHCGGNPGPNSGPNWSFSVPERWTILPYLNRGFTP